MNKFEMSTEQIKADEEAISAIRVRNLAKKTEEKTPASESFDWNEDGRVIDTSTAKVLAKDRVESDKPPPRRHFLKESKKDLDKQQKTSHSKSGWFFAVYSPFCYSNSHTEVSDSGLFHPLGKVAGSKGSREFESLHLRNFERSEKLRRWSKPTAWLAWRFERFFRTSEARWKNTRRSIGESLHLRYDQFRYRFHKVSEFGVTFAKEDSKGGADMSETNGSASRGREYFGFWRLLRQKT